ncbi:MAG: DUF1549 domain-containing protein [Planctomycetales bacterium]|nr:DUF1549 domain-containing protein [Planctomycetales bacterium]
MNYSHDKGRIEMRLTRRIFDSSRGKTCWLRHAVFFSLWIVAWHIVCPKALAQTISSISLRTFKPGQTVPLIVHGSELDKGMQLIFKQQAIQWQLEQLEPTQATFSVTLPEDVALGPTRLWLATSSGVIKPYTLFVDDLDAVIDNGQNHSLNSAQRVSCFASVEGICDSTASDFYCFHAMTGQRIAFEIHTQPLRSAMDPLIQLLDAKGEQVLAVDDTSVGPDCRFSYEFAKEGDYLLQIQDSRHAAAGAPYQLRIGDFPVVSQSFPMAVRTGEKSMLGFTGPDGSKIAAREILVPVPDHAEAHQTVFARAQFAAGQTSSWTPLLCSNHTLVNEPTPTGGLQLPIGINGRLLQPEEVDSYLIHGVKGQTISFAAKTRSLGSPALLCMQLFDTANVKIAETKVGDTDEWSFSATIPADGDYRLEVSDLLKRGGDQFSYFIDCSLSGAFSVALKPDSNTPEGYVIETEHGACAIDLQISRFGYDGEIDLLVSDSNMGVRILNPRIPANAKEAKIYLAATDGWIPKSLKLLQLVATAVDNPAVTCLVDSYGLRRAKEPFVLTPGWQADGAIVLSGTEAVDTPFTMEPTAPLQFARPTSKNIATLKLKRLDEKFKSPVEVLPNMLPAGWSLSSKIDKDNYTITVERGPQATPEDEQLRLLVYGEFNGRGRLQSLATPVQWIDPVRLELSFLETPVRGGRVRANIQLWREGSDPQPVIVTLPSLPQGISGPAQIEIAADQEQAELELHIAADVQNDDPLMITLNVSSQFAGQNFTVTSTAALPPIVDAPKSLTVFPAEIALVDSMSRQQLVVTGSDEKDATRDWTRHARLFCTDPQIAAIRDGIVYPVADGETEVVVEVGSYRRQIPVRVANATVVRKIEFESEVLVALSKQGCNSGACHGSPSGKGGFRLSLRAFDSQLDQLTLIREDFGRRVNPLDPEQSLLLLKPLMKVPHGGGKQLHRDDAAFEILRDWIAGGASTDPAGTPTVIKLETAPAGKRVLALADGGQQLAVTACFADGQRRDVTNLAAYATSDTAVANVDAKGFVTPSARGEVAISVRFLEHIESIPFLFFEDIEGFEWRSAPPQNYIDELVNAKLKQLQYLPAETCRDDEFLRRVSLDLLGILPTVQETTSFLADTSDDKRSRLIDRLLERDEYAKFWALKWGDLLRMTSKQVGDEGVYKYHRWIEQSLRDNMPYDEFARQLLASTGSTLANPPANFYRTSKDMNECVETISQVFLGARLQCAKCHNHPFERWTQDNYYGLGAFFHRIQRRKTDRPGEMFVYTSFQGEVTQPRTGQVMQPWLPQSGSVEISDGVDRRNAFADWLVRSENPFFARMEANRIWGQLFSRGIVDPIDDFRDSNPPSNTSLLDALAKDFATSGFDRKHLLRVILNSRTYQASCETGRFNQDELKYFSHQEPRLLGAEQLLDAINSTLGLQQTFASLPLGTLATQIPAPDLVKVDFLKVFGQPERQTACACERADDSNLGMAIELFNGPLIHEKLRDGNNRFRKAFAEESSVEAVIQEIYLAAICRPPTDSELHIAIEHCKQSQDPIAGVEDVCWALFNTDEFLFQH